MVKALDCRSGEDVRAGSNPITGSFFFSMVMAERRKRVQSAKPKGAKQPSHEP